ncbi:hypothetical protein [Paenarthrobacter sp. TA1.8]|uniref:hypothetical protein n=1 Tax=Paenarthrobacter sp. TA1.8 TaxID=3400219 RepID=UPI003B43230A
MTVRVTRTDDGLVLGTPATRPEFSAILEAAGAVLVWDVATGEALPAAIVWDPVLAAEWAWQIYGVEVTTALLAADSSPFAAVPGAALESARVVARCRWARSWWPASHRAAIPALDTRLLHLQEAAEVVELEHLLDDSDGLDDELRKGLRAAEYLENEVPPSLPSVVPGLIERIRSSADDRGISLDPIRAEASEGAQGEFALAAGATKAADVGTDSTRPIAAGSAPLDLSRVTPGTADAAAEARWSIHLIGGSTVLEVAVERAPGRGSESAPQPLAANFAGVSLELVPNAASFSGRAMVPAGILLTRPEERKLTIASPGYGDGWRVDSAALIDAARRALARALTEAGEGGEGSGGSAVTTVAEREAAVLA